MLVLCVADYVGHGSCGNDLLDLAVRMHGLDRIDGSMSRSRLLAFFDHHLGPGFTELLFQALNPEYLLLLLGYEVELASSLSTMLHG